MSKIVAGRRSVCRTAILACLPLLLMLVAGCQRAPAAKAAAPPPEVGVTAVHVTPVQCATALPGRTTAVTTSDVRPQITFFVPVFFVGVLRLFRVQPKSMPDHLATDASRA
jgi:hypothetical protein